MVNFNLVADYFIRWKNKFLKYKDCTETPVLDATSDNLPPFPSLEPGAGFRRMITVNYLY